MASIKRKGDRLSEENRNRIINEIIHYFDSERDEEIGRIAAEQLLNFFQETMGSEIYNQGIQDAKSTLKNRFEDLQFDLDELMD